jgi:ArsR family transcriptional regulator
MNVLAEVPVKDLARFFRVLADESRLQMLWLLFNHRELCVCDIMATLGITQSKASRHLAALRHAGLVSDRRAGTWSFYSLSPATSELERSQIESLRVWLASQAGAAQTLGDLRRVLERRDSAAVCAASGLGDPTDSGSLAGNSQPF